MDRQYKTNTYESEFFSIVVHRPVLDDPERKKREENLKRAVAYCGKEMLKRKG